ncbi:MAG TPA: hypothetical protein VLS45_01380, partial [Methylomicrobium sp.]|nr:hypothetical protein [Methylomicrobium sp.]
MKANFTPSAANDTDDYILAISSSVSSNERVLMNYDLIVIDDDATSAALHSNAAQTNNAVNIVNDDVNEIDNIRTASNLNPNASPFVASNVHTDAQPI